MEPSSEILELLREFRESQRELMELSKKWKEESDRKNQEWQEASDRRDREWKEEVAKSAPGIARWEELNELSLKWYEDRPIIDKTVLVLRLMLIAMLGIIAALLWFK
jgi:hypothetical protein